MKILIWSVSILAALIVSLLVLQTLASERVEVVELSTVDAHGETIVTRLWVMDDEGYQYLRVGADGSGWYTRLRANDTIKLTRGEVTKTYTTLIRPDKSQHINQLMQQKYTWGDSFFATLFGSREGSIPIELHEV